MWSGVLGRAVALLVLAQGTQAGGRTDDRVTLHESGVQASHALTLEDVVKQRDVSEPRLSPDGNVLVFLVTEAFLDCNCRRTALYGKWIAKDEAPDKLLEAEGLSNVQWRPRGGSITFLETLGGSQKLMSLDLSTHQISDLLESHLGASAQADFFCAESITGYRWSPDGTRIAIVRHRTEGAGEREPMIRDGYRYDDRVMWNPDVFSGDWARSQESASLAIYSIGDHAQKTVWTNRGTFLPEIGEVTWSPDSARIAFVERKGYTFDESIKILDSSSVAVATIESPRGLQSNLQWLNGARGLAYVSKSPADITTAALDIPGRGRVPVAAGVHMSNPWTGISGDSLYYLSNQVDHRRTSQGIYALSLGDNSIRRVTAPGSKVSDCDQIRNSRVACIVQSPTEPANVGLIDLPDGGVAVETELNTELRAMALNPVKELRWLNRFQEETTGYLLLPPQRRPARGFPLVVIAYGFDGDFVSRASHIHTSYPAQILANDGLAVLLFNYPPMKRENDSPRETLHQLGESPLASLKAIVDKLSAEGVVDRRSVGYAGHSFGGFLVGYALENSRLIAAAETNNGGTNVEPSSFLEIGNEAARNNVREQMGGPPWGASLEHYQRISVSLNADRVRAPVLMEYDAFEGASAFDLYSALRGAGVPTDFFIYPEDGHSFMLPSHQLQSMQRNLDWFRFWLKGEEDPDPHKAEQYHRWRSLQNAGSSDRNR
jgi:dipeptidyl aminopeptidase/acylaminoacyl peptidase